jgi:deoxycytidylate deaminase
MKNFNYPFLPEGRVIGYVPENNPFMLAAKEFARQYSLDKNIPTGAVLVRDGEIIGYGTNGSNYHADHGCERVKLGIPTGQQYELCEGCSPKNHAEPRSIEDAKKSGNNTHDADLYLWGHFWCCEPCWNSMIENGIANVFLMEKSEILFDREEDGNIIGRQFE